MIYLNRSKTATITCSNVQINFDTWQDLAYFKDSEGFYYDYTLFTLNDCLGPGCADKFYQSRR